MTLNFGKLRPLRFRQACPPSRPSWKRAYWFHFADFTNLSERCCQFSHNVFLSGLVQSLYASAEIAYKCSNCKHYPTIACQTYSPCSWLQFALYECSGTTQRLKTESSVDRISEQFAAMARFWTWQHLHVMRPVFFSPCHFSVCFSEFYNSNQDLSLRSSAPIGDRDVTELSNPKRMPLVFEQWIKVTVAVFIFSWDGCHWFSSFRNDLTIFIVEEDGSLTHLILRLRSLPEVPKINRLHRTVSMRNFCHPGRLGPYHLSTFPTYTWRTFV